MMSGESETNAESAEHVIEKWSGSGMHSEPFWLRFWSDLVNRG